MTTDFAPVAAFPWEINFKVGDIVALESGYVFTGDIFNGHHYSKLYIFVGVLKTEYKSNKSGYNRKDLDEIFIFRKVEEKDRYYSYVAGKFFVRTFYSGIYGDDTWKNLKVELAFDGYIHGNTEEDIVRAATYKDTIKVYK